MGDPGSISFHHHLPSPCHINESGDKESSNGIGRFHFGGGGGVLPKVDAGAWGLRSPCYGDSYGLCTESLGSESSCDESVGEGEDESSEEDKGNDVVALSATKREEEGEVGSSGGVRKRRDFPPPLPSLVLHGGATHRRSFMKAVRKDGRLILTPQFVVDTPPIFHACRRDGRLQLQLAQLHGDVEEEEEEEGEEEEEVEKESGEEHVVVEEEGGGEAKLQKQKQQQPPWQWVAPSNLEGYCCNRRCHDVPTRGEAGGSSPGQFPLFWRNHPFMATAT